MERFKVLAGRLNYCLISLFIIVYFSINALWLWLTAPGNLKPSSQLAKDCQSTFQPLLSLTGGEQNWSLFSPNISSENSYTLLVITMKNGLLKLVELPRIEKLKLVDKLSHEKHGKLFDDNMIKAENAFICPDIARFMSRVNNEPGNEPERIAFFLISNKIPLPEHYLPPAVCVPKHLPIEKYFVLGVNPDDL